MFSAKIVEFADPDHFIEAVRPSGCDLVVTGRGQFTARSVLVDLGRIHAQRGQERLTRLKHVATPRAGVIFLTEPGPAMHVNGAEVGMDQVALIGANEAFTSRVSGPTQWAAMTIGDDDWDACYGTDAGAGRRRVSGSTVLKPPRAALSTLRALHGALGGLAETNFGAVASRTLANDLEYGLVSALGAVLSTPQTSSHTTGRLHHETIVKRFREKLEDYVFEPVSILNIVQDLGVAARTLRLACQEQLGVSPLQYAMLHRLRRVHRRLRDADPNHTRVTDIATDHGFWELGRFSVKYRQVFGETPSETLRQKR